MKQGDVIDDSGWVQQRLTVSRRGGKREGAGRKKSASPKVFRTVGLTSEQWDFLESWQPTGNASDQLRELLERAMKFWPSGPSKFR